MRNDDALHVLVMLFVVLVLQFTARTAAGTLSAFGFNEDVVYGNVAWGFTSMLVLELIVWNASEPRLDGDDEEDEVL